MAENTYKLDGLFRWYAAGGSDDKMSISVFNQMPSFVVWKKDYNGKGPAVKCPISPDICMKIVEICKKLITEAPGTRIPLSFLTTNRETKAKEITATFVFGKSEKNVMYIEVGNKAVQPPVRFPFRSANNFAVGTDTETQEPERSRLNVLSFIHCLNAVVPTANLLSTFNMQPMPRGGNYGNNNYKSYGNNNNHGNYRNNGSESRGNSGGNASADDGIFD